MQSRSFAVLAGAAGVLVALVACSDATAPASLAVTQSANAAKSGTPAPVGTSTLLNIAGRWYYRLVGLGDPNPPAFTTLDITESSTGVLGGTECPFGNVSPTCFTITGRVTNDTTVEITSINYKGTPHAMPCVSGTPALGFADTIQSKEGLAVRMANMCPNGLTQ
jgi:hypothetical protein